MKELENIPKKDIFKVPDGYFDTLPGRVQARISEPDPGFVWRYKLQYALPAFIALLVAGIYWFQGSQNTQDAESILASIQTEELVAYLGESELTTDDLLEQADLDEDDADDIESEIYELGFDTEDLEEAVGNFDIENI